MLGRTRTTTDPVMLLTHKKTRLRRTWLMSSLPGTAWHVSFVASCCLHRSFARIILYYFLKKERIILYYPSAPARDLDRRQRSDVKSGSFESWWVPQWPRRQVGQAPWFLSTCSALLFTVRRPHQRNAKMLLPSAKSFRLSIRQCEARCPCLCNFAVSIQTGQAVSLYLLCNGGKTYFFLITQIFFPKRLFRTQNWIPSNYLKSLWDACLYSSLGGK
jgi:hypothetical protein